MSSSLITLQHNYFKAKKMNIGWLIDGDLFPEYRDELVSAIRDQGHDAKLIHAPSPPFRWDDVGASYRETFPKDACVVAHGDIELMTRIHKEQRWMPGAFCTVENYFCSKYICWIGAYWVNHDYTMLPFEELTPRKEFLFDTFGKEGNIFVRPDSPLKLFTGQLASHDKFDADVEFMGFYDFPPESLVVVSSPKTIVNEWRFVVAEREIVAGCKYSTSGELDYQPGYPDDALKLASTIATLDHEPDPVWIIDICDTADGAYHLLEIGGFSFADLYACNKSDIVKAVSATAKSVWEQEKT